MKPHIRIGEFVCVYVPFCQRLTERSGGLVFTGRRYLWHEAAKFCFQLRTLRVMVEVSGGLQTNSEN